MGSAIDELAAPGGGGPGGSGGTARADRAADRASGRGRGAAVAAGDHPGDGGRGAERVRRGGGAGDGGGGTGRRGALPALAPWPCCVGVPAVPPWRAGLAASALPQAYRDLLEVAEDAVLPVAGGADRRRGRGRLDKAKVEGLRSKLKRLVERGWLAEDAGPGLFTLPATVPGKRQNRALLPRFEGANPYEPHRKKSPMEPYAPTPGADPFAASMKLVTALVAELQAPGAGAHALVDRLHAGEPYAVAFGGQGGPWLENLEELVNSAGIESEISQLVGEAELLLEPLARELVVVRPIGFEPMKWIRALAADEPLPATQGPHHRCHLGPRHPAHPDGRHARAQAPGPRSRRATRRSPSPATRRASPPSSRSRPAARATSSCWPSVS